jgi:hypothetical protein
VTLLSQVATQIAVGELGAREQGGANRGPQVDQYLAAVRLDPGFPWCAAFAFWCFEMAARRMGITNPMPRTASTRRLWELADRHFRDPNPAPGRVYVLDHGNSQGHTGIVLSVDALGNVFEEVSGNTNAAGAREGNAVAIHRGTPEVSHGGTLLGYLDFDRPPPAVA